MYDPYDFNLNQRHDSKKDWSKRILQDINGLIHVLSNHGYILYCSESCFDLTGYHSQELIGKSLTQFLHTDDIDPFLFNFKSSFTSLTRMRTYFRWRRKDNTYLLLESIGQPKHNYHDQSSTFFAIAQPYLSKNESLFDSFLELKTENAWLKQRLKELNDKQIPNPISTTLPYEMITDNKDCSNKNWPPLPVKFPFNDFVRTLQQYDTSLGQFSPTSSCTSQMYRDPWKRRKKYRDYHHYMCNDCGTTASPEWRKGPIGPKTLCNACGLRWAKKNKKKGGVN
ncbi:hypothetical protein BDB01DRAFT_717305 [Pilobolus umbonatus]|nr:hypothetical protein BDB01DRAFT_717305 [Pilobolus umbonatus]